jgi:hypothetical protein
VSSLQTEYEFFLPKGFVDDQGQVHRKGTMRLATARDELEPLRDPRVRDADDPFLTIIVLSRVVSQLGSLSQVTPREIESLFAADLAYLQDVYGAINFGSPSDVADVIEDAEQRMREATQLARNVSRAAAATSAKPAGQKKQKKTRMVEVVIEDDEDIDEGDIDLEIIDVDDVDDVDDDLDDDVDGSDNTIDADALAARLQSQFGDDEPDDEDDEPVRVSSKRRHIEEIGTRSG